MIIYYYIWKLINTPFAMADDSTSKPRKLSEYEYITDLIMRKSGTVLWEYDLSTKELISYLDGPFAPNSTTNAAIYLQQIHPEDREKVAGIFEAMDNAVILKEENYRFRNASGNEYSHVTVFGTPVKDEDGKVTKYFGTRKDISEIYKLNELLQVKDLQSKSILNNSKCGYAFITPDYVVQWENISSTLKQEEARKFRSGSTCFHSVLGKKTPCFGCAVKEAMEKKVRVIRDEYTEVDGSITEIIATPILRNREMKGVVLRIDDITDKVNARKELENTTAKLQSIFESQAIGIIYFSKTGEIQDCNQKVLDIFGLDTKKEIFDFCRNFNNDERVPVELKKAINDGTEYENVIEKNKVTVTPIRNKSNEKIGTIVLLNQIM